MSKRYKRYKRYILLSKGVYLSSNGRSERYTFLSKDHDTHSGSDKKKQTAGEIPAV